ncbi:MAG: GNAT family N-acetyltransferase [Thermomicrobiales bacterium]|nr:GNAT family N-acetyltransferase [Thermomicrobiales bacterium]
MEITLRPITRENLRAVTRRMSIAPGQEGFVAPNAYSVAEAYIEPTWTPLAIYAGDEPVGFAMFGPEPETGRVWLIRYMIDAPHQGKGYGRAALRPLLDLMVERHGCDEIYLGYDPQNHVAANLYASFGFVPTGEIEDDEIIARLVLGNRSPDGP